MTYSLKQRVGAVVYDVPRLLWSTRASSTDGWMYMRNRADRVAIDPVSGGVSCDDMWTSDLHVANVFPSLGLRLMRQAFANREVAFETSPSSELETPDVTFIVGHRGMDRLAQLLTTLQTIAAQKYVKPECIVVEQSARPEVKSLLPSCVRYSHAISDGQAPYNRARAFNVGADQARGKMLVLHDNDMLIPADYASEVMQRFRDGFEVINLKRFVFYVSKSQTKRICDLKVVDWVEPPASIMQNALGGGSLAVSREAYFTLGGFDESFIGWGGEDNEFWERAQTRKVWPYGYLPLIHLWHEPQAGKFEQGRETASLFEERSAVPVERRIAELKMRNSAGQVGRSAEATTPMGAS